MTYRSQVVLALDTLPGFEVRARRQKEIGKAEVVTAVTLIAAIYDRSWGVESRCQKHLSTFLVVTNRNKWLIK